jgi:hypothetical protein
VYRPATDCGTVAAPLSYRVSLAYVKLGRRKPELFSFKELSTCGVIRRELASLVLVCRKIGSSGCVRPGAKSARRFSYRTREAIVLSGAADRYVLRKVG